MAVIQILHDHLHFSKVSARWVPKKLTREHKQNRLTNSIELLDRYEMDPKGFERRIVTGDECWVYLYDPETKRNSMEWRKVKEGPPRKFKQQRTTGKVLGCFFWDCEGLIYREYLQPEETVTDLRYAQQLRILHTAVIENRCGERWFLDQCCCTKIRALTHPNLQSLLPNAPALKSCSTPPTRPTWPPQTFTYLIN